ncbi:beta-1,3-galactosyl-O-glycosyl-glycoprotein beta-1,6-N-acetylglucosaminyltransferase-like [Lineus longissimus]|uniref:beta-1,3-galactosyl-O-glycosyl-glycoprotein beta-1,6-N-acetylglucosaminyltransferase-like n=1 Tax=Lineus longissimus TaxID=88925 RepID=UPI002B4E44D3
MIRANHIWEYALTMKWDNSLTSSRLATYTWGVMLFIKQRLGLRNKRIFGVFLACCGVLVIFSILSMTYSEQDKRKYAGLPSLTLWEQYLRRQRRNTAVPYCRGVIQNNQIDVKNALEYMSRSKWEYIPTQMFEHLTNITECERFKAARRYFAKPLSEKEAKFPLAYSIVVFKDVEQVERLLRAIYMPQNYYCIHVDKKSPKEIHTSLTKIADCFSNVFITSKLEDVRWGEQTMLQADINCMKDLLQYKNWLYFINLTGQEFPLVSNRELVDDLKRLNNTNVIDSFKETSAEFVSRTKVKWVQNSTPPYNITIYKGNLHNFFTREFVEYVINDEVPRHFLTWLNDTWAPEESFFASLHHTGNKHLNVPGSHTGWLPEPGFTYRYCLWHTGGDNAKNVCAGKWVRDVCVTGVGDLPKVVSSSGLFLNKIYLNFQPLTLDCLEEYHRNKTLRTAARNNL